MAIKKDGLAKPTKASSEDRMRCGECLHHKQSRHRQFDKPCSELGVKTFAIAPVCFTPDYTKVIHNVDEFVALSALIASKTPQQRKILKAILTLKPTGRKLKMGTKFYINIRGPEYVSNYLCGYVVGYTSAGEIVLTGSPSREAAGKSFFAYLPSDQSLLSIKEWKVKHAALKAKGRIVDPKVKTSRDIAAKMADDTYEVPTIDNAPKDTLKKTKKMNMRTTSLVQILSF